MKLPSLLSSIADSAIHFPDDVAICTDTADWTYAQLWSRMEGFRSALVSLALPAGVAVAVTAHKTVDTLALMLALGRQGHTTLAVSPSLGTFVKPMMFASAGVFCELTARIDHDNPEIIIASQPDLQTDTVSSAYVVDTCPLMLTTSGSTGIPKVVELNAEGVSAFFYWSNDYFKLTRGSRILSYAPFNFDLSLLEVWAPLAIGATVILVDTAFATQGKYLRTLIKNQHPDLIQAVPMFYNLICPTGGADEIIMDDIRHIVFTGDITSKVLRKRVAIAFPQATFHNIYGCTETNDSLVYSCDAVGIIKHERLPLGDPINGVTYRIVTEDGSELIGTGDGELHTSTPFLSHGYTDHDLTANAFYREQDGCDTYYRTGDRVARDEHGQLTLLGRNDFIVKVRGVRTNLQDIEQVLAKITIVKNAVVVPVDNETAGVTLHAIIEPAQGQKLDGMSIRLFCAQHLPKTSIPSQFHLHENPLPKTSTGKLDRKIIAKSIYKRENLHDS